MNRSSKLFGWLIATAGMLCLLGLACTSKKEGAGSSSAILRLHDLWALQSIGGQVYERDASEQHPLLELYPEDRRVSGTDGCNQIMGSLQVVDASQIEFGVMGGTKKMCRQMEIPGAFLRSLRATRSYRLEQLELIFMDENGQEIMRLKKVD